MQTANPLSFKTFIKSIKAAKPATRNFSGEKAATEFEAIRTHLLDHYAHVEVVHSFMDDFGDVWDSIPADDQPALKRTGAKLATPPRIIPFHQTTQTTTPIPLSKEKKADKFGNIQECPPGTFAKRRLALDELERFETLENFYSKYPNKTTPQESQLIDPHQHAIGTKSVANYGAHSSLNIWAPAIFDSDGMSISQVWMRGGAGQALQTVECGWHVYPKKYGNNWPHLFTFWTAKGYDDRTAYNGEDHSFVFNQNSPYRLGGVLSPVSQQNGPQYVYSLFWVMHEGNWWFYVQAADQAHAVGYYPGSVFQNGQLSRYAERVDFGGETYSQVRPPQMGSGRFAQDGGRKAAYQYNVSYIDNNNTAVPANLDPIATSPELYNIALSPPTPGGSAFYFGGPGAPPQQLT